MTDFYNAFLSMLMFNQHADNVTMLFVDAHPQGGLDDVWRTLFGKLLVSAIPTGNVVRKAYFSITMGFLLVLKLAMRILLLVVHSEGHACLPLERCCAPQVLQAAV
jgi:hypothetical protein